MLLIPSGLYLSIVMEGIMECPYLTGVYMKYCIAEKHDYVPSVYELREYCKERQHRVCRFYLTRGPMPATVTQAPPTAESRNSLQER